MTSNTEASFASTPPPGLYLISVSLPSIFTDHEPRRLMLPLRRATRTDCCFGPNGQKLREYLLVKKAILLGFAGLVVCLVGGRALAQTYGEALTAMPRELEIRYALSAK